MSKKSSVKRWPAKHKEEMVLGFSEASAAKQSRGYGAEADEVPRCRQLTPGLLRRCAPQQ